MSACFINAAKSKCSNYSRSQWYHLHLSCATSLCNNLSYFQLYKGKLENGTLIAIRCLALHQRYSIRNLKLRLDLLAKLRHPNLVCLLGHCIDSTVDESTVKRVFLVYEYVPSGALSSYLSGNNLTILK
jgi:hypothetical protein